MDNPWIGLKIDEMGRYILDIDREIILQLQRNLSGEHELKLELFPAPFDGDPNAPIYLLNLNPGFGENDINEMSRIREYVFNNLKHQPMEYPFCNLDPKLNGTGGSIWWKKILGPLLRKIKNDKLVSQKIFCVEYFPYHSKSFNANISVPSQKYNMYLIKKAMNNNSIFIIMRKEQNLYSLIPELWKHKEKNMVFSCINNRRPWISENNIENNGFFKIVEKILN